MFAYQRSEKSPRPKNELGLSRTDRALLAKLRPILPERLAAKLDRRDAWGKIFKAVNAEMRRDADLVAQRKEGDQPLRRDPPVERQRRELLGRVFSNIHAFCAGGGSGRRGQISAERLPIIGELDRQEAWGALVQVLARLDRPEDTYFALGGEKLIRAMVQDVYANPGDRKQLGHLLQTLATFRGPPAMLRDAVALCADRGLNPYEAFRNMEWRELPGEDIAAADPAERLTATGTAGAPLAAGRKFRFSKQGQPDRAGEVGYEGLLTWVEAFNPGQAAGLRKGESLRGKQTAEISRLLQKALCADLELEQGAADTGESRLLTRNALALVALQQFIEKARGEAYYLKYGENFLSFSADLKDLAADPGGTLWGRTARRKQLGQLSEAEGVAFAELRDHFDELSSSDRWKCITVLVIGDRQTRKVDKQEQLGPLQRDLELYQRLEREQPELLRELKIAPIDTDALKMRVENILQGHERYVDYAALAKVHREFDALAVMRRKLNARSWAQFADEVQLGVRRLRPLFQEEVAALGEKGEPVKKFVMRAVARQESVPLEWLRANFKEARETGVPLELAQRPAAKAAALLDVKELRTIRDMLFYLSASEKDRNLFFGSLDTERFGELLAGFVVVLRKVRDFDEQPAAAAKPLTILAARDYRLAERFSDDGFSLSLNEVLQRQRYLMKNWLFPQAARLRAAEASLAILKREAEAGLYRKMPELERLHDAAVRLVPRAELEQALALQRRFSVEPLKFFVYVPALSRPPQSPYHHDPSQSPYFSQLEAQALRRLTQAAPQMADEPFADLVLLNNLNTGLRQVAGAYLVEGRLAADRSLQLTVGPAELGLRQQCRVSLSLDGPEPAFTYVSPLKLRQVLAEVERKYVAGDKLPAGWLAKLQQLMDPAAARRLVGIQGPRVGVETRRAVDSLSRLAPLLVNRNLVEAVQAWK